MRDKHSWPCQLRPDQNREIFWQNLSQRPRPGWNRATLWSLHSKSQNSLETWWYFETCNPAHQPSAGAGLGRPNVTMSCIDLQRTQPWGPPRCQTTVTARQLLMSLWLLPHSIGKMKIFTNYLYFSSKSKSIFYRLVNRWQLNLNLQSPQ